MAAPALPRVPARAARVPGGSRPDGPPGVSRYLGAAVSLHALVLLAGARLALQGHAVELPAGLGATTWEDLVDVVRAPPERDEDRSSEAPRGDGAPPRGAAGSAGRGPERRSAPRATGPAETPERAGAGDHQEDAAPYRRVVLPGERSGALEAWSRTFRERASALPAIPLSAAGEGHGADTAGSGADAPAAAGGDQGLGGGTGDGTGGAGRKSAGRPGGSGWGESWDSVAGPHPQEPGRPAPLLDSGAKADEATLPRRTVGAVVGRSASRLRLCYEDGRRRDASLAGRLLVRFSVDTRGRVLVAADGGTTIADPAVIRCVLTAFAAMTFPARSHGGAVWTTHLVAFPPGE